jgi:hypothetical protein
MEVTYTISTGWKVFYGVFAAIPTFGAVCFLSLVGAPKVTPIVFAPIGASVVLLALAILVGGQLRKKVIISADKIVGINVLQRRELATSNIKGCRIGEKVITIEPASSPGKKIIINNYSDFNDSKNLVNWLKENFKDLDATDLNVERDSILNDASLGSTKEEREAKITRAKWIGVIYSMAGLIIGLGSIPFGEDKAVAMIDIIYPLIGIILMATSNGLIKFVTNSKRSVRSFTVLGIFMPSFMLTISAALGYNIDEYQPIIVPALSVCLPMMALVYFIGINRDLPSIAGQAIFMLIVSAAYGYGTVVKINCLFDESEPKLSHATIYNKSKEYSKGEHYYLDINAFSPANDQKQIEVGEARYNKYNIGDSIGVDLKKGYLGIPWYYLSPEN